MPDGFPASTGARPGGNGGARALEPTQPKGGARRNRYAACQLAGIEPVFTTYDGDDPAGAALAVNIAHRHLTKGQQAMIAAKALRVLSQNMREGTLEGLAGEGGGAD